MFIEKMEPDSSWRCTASNGRGNGHKLQLKLQLSSRTNPIAITRVMKHWNGLPIEAVESPSLKRHRFCLGKALSSLMVSKLDSTWKLALV